MVAQTGKDIEDVVANSQSCADQRSLPPVAPPHTWLWARHPIQCIDIYFASIEQFHVLVIIDSHPKWTKSMPLCFAKASTMVGALRLSLSVLDCAKR